MWKNLALAQAKVGKLLSDTFRVSGGEDGGMSCGLRATRASAVIAIKKVASRFVNWIYPPTVPNK